MKFDHLESKLINQLIQIDEHFYALNGFYIIAVLKKIKILCLPNHVMNLLLLIKSIFKRNKIYLIILI